MVAILYERCNHIPHPCHIQPLKTLQVKASRYRTKYKYVVSGNNSILIIMGNYVFFHVTFYLRFFHPHNFNGSKYKNCINFHLIQFKFTKQCKVAILFKMGDINKKKYMICQHKKNVHFCKQCNKNYFKKWFKCIILNLKVPKYLLLIRNF